MDAVQVRPRSLGHEELFLALTSFLPGDAIDDCLWVWILDRIPVDGLAVFCADILEPFVLVARFDTVGLGENACDTYLYQRYRTHELSSENVPIVRVPLGS